MKIKLLTIAFLSILFTLPVVGANDQAPLPSQIDLSLQFDQWELPRRSQASRPTCSVFAVVGALEFTQAKYGKKPEYLSVEYANWAKNQAVGTSTDGGFFHNIWRGIRRHGICAENLYPYKDKFDAQAEPDETARKNAAEFLEIPTDIRWIKRWDPKIGLNDSQFLEIKKTLHEGLPVSVGLRWPRKAEKKDDVLLWVPEDGVYDGHSILFIGYQDDEHVEGGGYFITRNTNNRRQNEKMSYRYAKDYANDAIYFPLRDQTAPKDAAEDLQGPVWDVESTEKTARSSSKTFSKALPGRFAGAW